MIEKQCDHCGDIFSTNSTDLKRGWGKYCSRRCLGLAKLTTANAVRHSFALSRQLDVANQPATHRLLNLRDRLVRVSIEDFDEVIRHAWYVGANGYCTTRLSGKLVTMHRFIMRAGFGELVDHINGDRLDNRRSNLRFVSVRTNAVNSARRVNGSSKFKGVVRKRKRWCATISPSRTSVYIGVYSDESEAAWMYDQYAIALYGDDARLNFAYY